MKTACLILLALCASCTVPTAADGGEAAAAGATGTMVAEGDAIYVDGLLDPVEDDGRSLRERDLERIGRRP
ncbi:MAG: hypothetical protein ACYTF3_04840 [Planctomycetota bacterium]|jgi:hypothetical protein